MSRFCVRLILIGTLALSACSEVRVDRSSDSRALFDGSSLAGWHVYFAQRA